MLRKIFRFRRVNLTRNLSSTPDATTTFTDENEMKKFSKRAAQMWDINGPDKPLHFMNQLRVPLIRNVLLNHPIESQSLCHTPSPLKNYHILDAGCGVGILSEPLTRLGADVTGIDPVEENIVVASEHCSCDPSLFTAGGSLNYKCCTVEDVANGPHQFDLVVASEVLEHITQLDHFISHLGTMIKPGGYAVFTTINRTAVSYITGILLAEYLLRMMPVGTHEWEKFITPSELEQLLAKNGLIVIFQRDNFYNPLLGRWSWCSRSGVGYAMVAKKPEKVEEPQEKEGSTPT